jgi:hypothetical protein
MTNSNRHHEYSLGLSRDEQWILHHVMLDRIELEAQHPNDTDPPPFAVYRAFEKIEAGTHRFSWDEYQCLIDELHQYANSTHTPKRDQPIVEQLLNKL